MTPVLRQSGRTRFLRRPNGGNKSLKRVFYQSAFCSLAQDDSRTFYERNRRERKRHHQAVIALARRRINVLWAVVQSRTPFPNQIQIGHVTEPLGCLWLLPDDCASGVVVGQSMRSQNTANWPSGYSRTRTFAFTKCGRNRAGGNCRLSLCHFTVLSLPTVRSAWMHRISCHTPVVSVTNAEPSCSASIANRLLCSAM